MSIRTLWYAGLEQLESRYTLQLTDWNQRAFDAAGIPFQPIGGELLSNSKQIVTGSVLDAHGRSYFSLTQNANIIKMLQRGQMTNEDVLFYEDMFTPGIETLAYVFDQTPAEYRPRVFVRCLAQTIDPDDFVNREGMFDWMRAYEKVVEQVVIKSGGAILVASEEMVAHLRIAGFKAPIYVTGLPFGLEEVQSRVPQRAPYKARDNRVCFAARWDDEKQPLFFIEVAREVAKTHPEIEFCVLSGHASPKSNNPELLNPKLWEGLNLHFMWGLKKNEYYSMLAQSKLLFNCALQDWVSNTVSEASALGTMQLYPAYRSFPEVFDNDDAFMYIPWSVKDAARKVIKYTVENGAPVDRIANAAIKQNKSIPNTISVMLGNAEHLARNGNDYRKEVSGYGRP